MLRFSVGDKTDVLLQGQVAREHFA